jgi:hypothetical protein
MLSHLPSPSGRRAFRVIVAGVDPPRRHPPQERRKRRVIGIHEQRETFVLGDVSAAWLFRGRPGSRSPNNAKSCIASPAASQSLTNSALVGGAAAAPLAVGPRSKRRGADRGRDRRCDRGREREHLVRSGPSWGLRVDRRQRGVERPGQRRHHISERFSTSIGAGVTIGHLATLGGMVRRG